MERRSWKVWKTIKLGTGLKIANDFRRALQEGGFRIGVWAGNILEKNAFRVATKETEVDLVVVSISDLGFKDRATLLEIYKRALELGLDLCPLEVGPQLRVQYKDQPFGEKLYIAMRPITDSDASFLGVFSVDRGGDEGWLYGVYGGYEYFWSDDCRWVFLRPKPN